MATTLAKNALVTLADLKEELGISDSSQDNLLIRKINAASAAIETFCNRKLVMSGVVDTLAGPTQFTPRLIVRQPPLLVRPTVVPDVLGGNTTPLADGDFSVEDAILGYLYRAARWTFTGLRQLGIVQDFEPGTEAKTIQAAYVGGYVTQPQIDAAAAWPGAAATVAPGLLLNPVSQTNQIWVCTTAGVTAGTQPAWPAAAVAQNAQFIGTTQADGTAVWTYLGTKDGSGNPAKSLPPDLEQAAFSTACSMFLTKGQNTNIRSESLMSYSVSYGAQLGIPADAEALLGKYQVVVIG